VLIYTSLYLVVGIIFYHSWEKLLLQPPSISPSSVALSTVAIVSIMYSPDNLGDRLKIILVHCPGVAGSFPTLATDIKINQSLSV
jgi:hypothetical protein